MPPIKKHIMDKQEQSAAAAAAAASTNVAEAESAAGPQGKQTPQLHDHAQVLQEAASALRSLHDGESSDSNNSPAGSKRSSAVAPNVSSSTTTGGALQAAVEAAFASTTSTASAAFSSKKNKSTSDGSSDADGGGSSNPKKRKHIDGPSTSDTANTTTQFDEEIPLTFPQRLMELLDDEGNDDIIGWLPHGRGFLICQKRRFASELMGKYFKQSKFTSFTRKLNRWGFTRISRGPETGAYYHPYFRKGNARLCLQMTCQSLKSGPSGATGAGTGAGATVSSNTAPPSMPQHQEASTAAAQLAVPKAAQMQQSLQQQQQQQQQQPIAPAPGLPNASPMAATILPNTAAAAAPSSSSAELLRTETATESVLRLRQLQRQQEQLMIRQRQIREEIQAISAALPEKIAQERRQQQVMAAAASSTAAGQAGQTMAPAATPNATPVTQPTPPSGSTGIGTAPAPSAATQGQDPAYSKAIVDAAIETLKRSNTNAYLTLLMARQQQQQQQQQHQGAKQARAVSGPIAPAPAMATPAAATPATAAAASTQPASFQSQLRQTVRAQLHQMRLAQQAQQIKQTMEGVTLTDDGRLKAGPGTLHPAQAAAKSGTYRSGSQGQKRPSGAKRASAA